MMLNTQAVSQPRHAPANAAAGGAPSDLQPITIAQADPAAPQYRIGTHYRRLTPVQPTSSGPETIEAAEVFAYDCIDCASLDQYFRDWVRARAGSVTHVRIPSTAGPLGRFHARAFYTAEALGISAQMHSAFYRAIHLDGNALDTELALAEFFSRFGVRADDFQRTFNSLAVHMRLEQADQLARRYRIESLPAVVINGKNATSLSMAGNIEVLVDIIDYLVTVEIAN